MADVKEPSFTSRIIKQGDTWSTIAYEEWGDANKFRDLIYDNPHLPVNSSLPVGVTIYVRVLDTPTTGVPVPPWLADETLNETLGETDSASIPVVDGPPVPLGFSPGYPKVENNRISFAINKSSRFPYLVETQDGKVFAESSGYDFSAGFPVVTSTIQEGGRYRVRVGSLISGFFTVEGAGAPLAFAIGPTISKEGSVWKVRYAINKTGTYPTRIVNKATSLEVYRKDDSDYTAGIQVTLDVLTAGTFTIYVGGISFEFKTYTETEVTEKPSWITAAGYRYDANSHAFTKYIEASADVEVRISLPAGTGPDGINQDGQPWDAVTYNPGTSSSVISPYTERFSFNSRVFAVGGLSPLTTYRARVRKASDPSIVFTYLFTTSGTTTPPGVVTVIDISGAEQIPACKRGPTLSEIYNPTATSLGFLFDGLTG